jgi:hypothetical protein
MTSSWPTPEYGEWSATCDTLHAHTQVLGKVALAVAPPEPELQHAALRLTPRGWETAPLPAPDGSGTFAVALDLRTHEGLVEHSDGREQRIPLTPNRAVAEVTRDVLDAVRELAGGVEINPKPQEVPWETPLDEDTGHATYDPAQVEVYFLGAIRAALVLGAFRAPWRGRSTPVNAWWGSFDLAVHVFSGRPADAPSDGFIARNTMDAQQIAVGWWPGDRRYPRPAFYGFAFPAPDGLHSVDVSPGRWDEALGEFLFDARDAASAPDPHAAALAFARTVAREVFVACNWDSELAGSIEGSPPPIR